MTRAVTGAQSHLSSDLACKMAPPLFAAVHPINMPLSYHEKTGFRTQVLCIYSSTVPLKYCSTILRNLATTREAVVGYIALPYDAPPHNNNHPHYCYDALVAAACSILDNWQSCEVLHGCWRCWWWQQHFCMCCGRAKNHRRQEGLGIESTRSAQTTRQMRCPN